MKKTSVDLEKIAELLTDSAVREEAGLQKIAELESELRTLKEELKLSSFPNTDITKEASYLDDGQYTEMGSVENEMSSEEFSDGRERLNSFLESIS